ncbi:MAG: biotin carboxylase, partial [Ignavibacteriales bacterium]|nr:biotin carboxylase [Ignavibacteriales bacterium]
LVNPHHVEVQILGDKSGRVVSFPERDCSLQRRHQKLVEESPSPVVNSALRERIMSVAAQLAAAAGYRNAGTVEFLVDESGNFYFLEVNTRLQVEHPVTEAVTGLDFVREQIMLAEGCSLAVRQEEIPLRGHALECRIYAEDPANDFFPSIGKILAFEPPSGPGIRVDTGARTGDAVGVHFDPLLAKVITHGSNRSEAIQRMVRALGEFGVSGIHTTVPFCKHIIQSEIFLQAKHTTQLINQELLRGYLTLSVKPQEFAAASVAAILFARESKPRETKATATATPNGWRKRRTEYYE